ncbi:sensor histidine kinase [Larkinella soli]|uniref:sensor histidine kinase n=1 Tax=Larkinella soli TaxID=1770527 RepID=UPI000FFC7DDB|nr:sensor histidine kinase [Larkinella soli]
MNRPWFITLLFLFPVIARGQTPAPLRFEHLTARDGLAHNVVYAILQDRQGFLWFGTDNGLSKYDGYTFTNYRKIPGDTTSLSGNAVIRLMEDRQGNLWLGMLGQGLCKFDRRTERFTSYGPTPHTLSQGSIQSLVEDAEGQVWVVNGNPELRRFDPRTGAYSRFNYADLLTDRPGRRPHLHDVYRDRSGTIWAGSTRGLHRMHPDGAGQPPGIRFTTWPFGPVWEIFEDHAGVLWVITGRGLGRFDRKSGRLTPLPYRLDPSPAVNALINRNLRHLSEDHLGNLWMGTNTHGLVRLDRDRTRFEAVGHDPGHPQSLRANLVRTTLVDRSGLLWAGVWGEGVAKANPGQQPFRHYRPLPGTASALSNKYVDAILEDRSGTVWLATGAGLDRLDPQTGRFTNYRFEDGRSRDRPVYVNALLEDRDGNLWVGSQGDLARFDRRTGTFTSYTRDSLRYPGLGGNTKIIALYEDRQGLIWLGTQNGLKSFDRRTGRVVHYAYDPRNSKGIADAWAIALCEDRHGNLWVGSGSVALNRLDRRTGVFTHFRPDPRRSGSITSDVVPAIFQDSKGNLWFGTAGGGLCRFDEEKQTFQAFTQADGLADHSIYSIQEDNSGQLWLGTSKGLSRFSFADRTFINYDRSDGLPEGGFRIARCRGRSGMLYFGGENGFTAFDPRRLTTNRHVPPVAVTQIRLFDRPLPPGRASGALNLNYDENFLSFEFSALNYANPGKNQYAYRLEGLEENWVRSGSRRQATYTDLDPGTYVFRVRGSNNDGVWNRRGTSVRFVIHPPWWQTVWFRLVAAGVLLLGAFSAVRLYTRERLNRQRQEMKRVLEAQEGERQRLAADLHDDLGATLAAIKVQLEIAHEPDDGLSRPIRLLEKAILDLRHISHNLMPPEFSRLGLTEALRDTVSRTEANAGISFLFISFGPERRLDHEVELTIYRIAVELIQNAVRHARARQVTIQLIFYPQHLSLLVEDDGHGYAALARTRPAGIGLRNIRSRVAYLNSKLVVDSGQRGTTVILEVPTLT